MVDRAMMSIPKVRRRTKIHLRNLLLSGIILASLLFVVSLIGLINESMVVKNMLRKSDAKVAVQQFSIISSNLYEEMQLRILSPDKTNEIATASDAWQTALKKVQGTFNEELTSSVIQIAELFEAVTDRGEILYAYVYLLSMLTAVVFLMLQDTYSDRASATTESLSIHSAHAGIGSLFSRIIYYAGKPQNYPVPYQCAYGLFMQYVVAAVSPYFSLRALGMANDNVNMLEYGMTVFSNTMEYAPTTNTVELLSLSSTNTYINALYETTQAEISVDKADLYPLYYFIVGTILISIALVLCCVVFCYYCTRSSEARTLASTFEDPRTLGQLRAKYLPVIQELRAVGDAEERTNIVNRVYSIAACWMDVLRTLTPQLLFGSYPDRSRDWSLLEQDVHLSVGKTRVCRRVLAMEVSISVHVDEQRPFYERELSEQLELLNELYRIVVSETNAAGGVVLGLRGNVSVVGAWNTTSISRHASLLALRAAHRMQHRLKGVPGMPRVLITMVTGPVRAHTLSAGCGQYACLLGGMLGYLQALKLAGTAMGLTMMLDRNTARHLPRLVAQLMKPLVVMRLRTRAGNVTFLAYSGDDLRMDDVVRNNAYTRCFSLYQSNLLNESTVAFQRYLHDYPDDEIARWVFEFVVKPKFQLSLEEVDKRRSSMRASGDAPGVVNRPHETSEMHFF